MPDSRYTPLPPMVLCPTKFPPDTRYEHFDYITPHVECTIEPNRYNRDDLFTRVNWDLP